MDPRGFNFELRNNSDFGETHQIPNTIDLGMKGLMSLYHLCQNVIDKNNLCDYCGSYNLNIDQDANNPLNIDVTSNELEHFQNANELIQLYSETFSFFNKNTFNGSETCFTYAFGFIIFHELGHILYNHENNCPKCQEWRADNFAIDILLHGDEDAQQNVGLARPIGILLGASLPFILGDKNDDNHPEPIERMNSCLIRIVSDLPEDDKDVIREVARYIQGNLEEIKNEIQA